MCRRAKVVQGRCRLQAPPRRRRRYPGTRRPVDGRATRRRRRGRAVGRRRCRRPSRGRRTARRRTRTTGAAWSASVGRRRPAMRGEATSYRLPTGPSTSALVLHSHSDPPSPSPARSVGILRVKLRLGWLGSRVVSVLDSGVVGPGFRSQSRRCRVLVLGKLFTPIVPLFTEQRNW